VQCLVQVSRSRGRMRQAVQCSKANLPQSRADRLAESVCRGLERAFPDGFLGDAWLVVSGGDRAALGYSGSASSCCRDWGGPAVVSCGNELVFLLL
jgi:hypothetical protein